MAQESNLYKNAKRATVKEARALKIGDIIACYYTDSEQPVYELVVDTRCGSKTGFYTDVYTTRIDNFGKRGHEVVSMHWLNTDKFKRVAHGADIGERLAVTAQQSAGVIELASALTPKATRPRQVGNKVVVDDGTCEGRAIVLSADL